MSDSIQKWDDNSQGLANRFQYIPNSNHAFETEEKPLEPRKLLSLVGKYKWIILLFVLGGAVAAWFYTDTVTPVYESNGTLLISSGENATMDELSRIISQTTGHQPGANFENELQILQSRRFSMQVAAKLFADTNNAKQYPILWTEDEDGTVEMASIEKVANTIRKNLVFFQANEDSDIIKVSFQSTSPEEASLIVNLAMQNYIDNSSRQNLQAANSTAEFLENEKETLSNKLQESEQALRSYMDATGIVQVNEQTSGMVAQRADAEVELQRINVELKAIEESIADYQQQLDRINPGLAEQFTEAIGPRIRNAQELLANFEEERSMIISKNPGVLQRDPLPARIQYLDKEITRLKSEIRDLSSKLFTSDNQFMGMNTEDRAQMVSNIQAQLLDLELQRNQLESRREALSEHKQEMDADFNSLPRGIIELAKLQRDVRINEELYLNVSRQYADMSVWQQSQFGFGRIIDQGHTPNTPISPNRIILVLLGIMMGGFVAAGFVFIREFKDNSVNELGQLRTAYFPPLTVIPSIEETNKKYTQKFEKGSGRIPKELVLLQNKKSITAESMRRLKNNIIYQNGDRPPKTIVVTSPEKGDGKSTISANLGVAFAEEGYWTLVVDADFRRPRLHTYFGLVGKNGLSNYLNNEIAFEHLLKETDLETLKVIPAGYDIKSPEVLSNNAVFKRLLKKMEDVFDVIIIDTPPYGIISDSSALLKYAEATVVVAKYRKTNKGLLFKTMQELKEINANVVSVVLNNFNHKKEVGNYYGDGFYQALYSNYDEYK